MYHNKWQLLKLAIWKGRRGPPIIMPDHSARCVRLEFALDARVKNSFIIGVFEVWNLVIEPFIVLHVRKQGRGLSSCRPGHKLCDWEYSRLCYLLGGLLPAMKAILSLGTLKVQNMWVRRSNVKPETFYGNLFRYGTIATSFPFYEAMFARKMFSSGPLFFKTQIDDR